MKESRWQKTRICISFAVAAILSACGSVQPEDMVGSYYASTFRTSTANEVEDILDGGGVLNIRLSTDGTTSGDLFVPAALSGEGQDLTASLDGTWYLNEGVVHFSQNADTFVRDIPWEADPGRLIGSGTFSGTLVEVTLIRR